MCAYDKEDGKAIDAPGTVEKAEEPVAVDPLTEFDDEAVEKVTDYSWLTLKVRYNDKNQ